MNIVLCYWFIPELSHRANISHHASQWYDEIFALSNWKRIPLFSTNDRHLARSSMVTSRSFASGTSRVSLRAGSSLAFFYPSYD
jgi:hypothetical protein